MNNKNIYSQSPDSYILHRSFNMQSHPVKGAMKGGDFITIQHLQPPPCKQGPKTVSEDEI